MNRPLVSVITVVYNARPTLEATIKSVLNQDSNLVEYWIIDGGSTDGSLDVIRQYEHQLTGWISEPDKGIYDAMNKGINRANGKWLYFLGADDQLVEGIFTILSRILIDDYSLIYGNVIYDTGYKMYSKLGYRTLFENTIHHQGAFYNRNLFDNFRYNTNYYVVSDYELNLYIYINKLNTKYTHHIIALCGSAGISSVLSSTETNHLRSKYIKNPTINLLISTTLNTYYIYFRAKKRIKNYLSNIFV